MRFGDRVRLGIGVGGGGVLVSSHLEFLDAHERLSDPCAGDPVLFQREKERKCMVRFGYFG